MFIPFMANVPIIRSGVLTEVGNAFEFASNTITISGIKSATINTMFDAPLHYEHIGYPVSFVIGIVLPDTVAVIDGSQTAQCIIVENRGPGRIRHLPGLAQLVKGDADGVFLPIFAVLFMDKPVQTVISVTGLYFVAVSKFS